MDVKQIYSLMNSVSGEVLGKTDLIQEDLTGIVDMGVAVFNQNAVDNYVKSLVNHIGKVVFVNRPYAGKIPSVLMDAWEFGSVLEKISADIPAATENDSWDLTDGQTYSQDVFHKPTVTAKFYNSKVTFEVPVSITERQVKESFSSAEQLNGFISMIYNAVDKSMTIKTDALVMRTINNMIAETVQHDIASFTGGDLGAGSSNRAVNLLYLYNTRFNKSLTAEDALTDQDFIRYASYIMGMYADRMATISTLFNCGGKERFTAPELLHTVLLSDFSKAAEVYLYSDTFNKENVRIPKHESVSCWQGTGKTFAFEDVSKVYIKKGTGLNTVETTVPGVLGVMFDRDALGVTNLDRRVTSNYNAKAEFFNNYFKFDAGYFNDTNENFVVFFVADPAGSGSGSGSGTGSGSGQGQ